MFAGRYSYESAVSELNTVKSDLKTANKVALDAGKLVANLEGQLGVYKSLDKPVKGKKNPPE